MADKDIEVSLEGIKALITTLQSRNAALADENNALKLEIESMKTEMGGGLFRNRSTFGELISAVEGLKEAIYRKANLQGAVAQDKPIKVLMAEVSPTPSTSMQLARKLIEGDEDLSLTTRRPTPVIEEL